MAGEVFIEKFILHLMLAFKENRSISNFPVYIYPCTVFDCCAIIYVHIFQRSSVLFRLAIKKRRTNNKYFYWRQRYIKELNIFFAEAYIKSSKDLDFSKNYSQPKSKAYVNPI